MANGNNNPFGSLSGLATTSSLKLQEEARNRLLQERRRENLGPVNAIGLQFGEALGNLIRKKGFGNLTEEERGAIQNTDTLTKGLDRAMRRIEEEGIELGTPEARMTVLEEQFGQAMRDGNLKAADAISKSLMDIQEQQLRMEQLKAGTDFTRQRTDRLVEQTTLDYLRLQAERNAQEAARRAAAEKGADSLRQEIDTQIKDATDAAETIERAERLATEGTAAGDTGLVFAVLKAWDPGARITDQDFKLGADEAIDKLLDSEDTPQAVKTYFKNLVVTGERFTDEQRISLINAVRAGARPKISTGFDVINDARNLARTRGYDVDAVISGSARNILDTGDRIAPIKQSDVSAIVDGTKTLRGVLGFRDLDSEIRGL